LSIEAALVRVLDKPSGWVLAKRIIVRGGQPRAMADTSGAPGRKAITPDPFLDAMTEEKRRAVEAFVRDPVRLRKSAEAYVALLMSGALDDVH
jgi:hypothetical protein